LHDCAHGKSHGEAPSDDLEETNSESFTESCSTQSEEPIDADWVVRYEPADRAERDREHHQDEVLDNPMHRSILQSLLA